MSLPTRLASLGRNLFRRGEVEATLDQELRSYVDALTAEKMAAGMDRTSAERASRLEAGVEQVKEAVRDVRTGAGLTSLDRDVRYALRAIRRRPVFAGAIVVTLAVGIGVNAAMFSLVKVFFQPLPVRDGAGMVGIQWARGQRPQRVWFTYDDFTLLREQLTGLSGVIASSGLTPVILGPADAGQPGSKIYASFVSDGYFTTLGGGTILGRPLLPGDNSAPGIAPVAVLSHRFWQSEFAGDPDVVGRFLVLNGKRIEIVGVAPADFIGEGFELRGPAVWLPLMMRGELAPAGPPWFSGPGQDWLQVSGRLSPDHSWAGVQAETRVLGPRLRLRHPGMDPEMGVEAFRIGPMGAVSSFDQAAVYVLAMIAPAIVLLITCANLANVMLARAAARQKEIGVRLALGASRGRVVRQLLVESGLLTLLGAGLAVLIVAVSIRTAAGFLFDRLGHRDPLTAAAQVSVDAGVLLLVAGAAIATVLAFGLAPAYRATRPDLVRAFKDESGGRLGQGIARSRLRGILVVTQVACSFVLLLSAGLLVRAMASLSRLDTGIAADQVLVVDVRPSLAGYDTVRADRFGQEVAARLEHLSGIRAVGRAWIAPFEGAFNAVVRLPGASGEAGAGRAAYNRVTPTFFEAVGIPLVLGRTFTDGEWRSGAAVVVVSQRLANRVWPEVNPIGQLMQWDSTQPPSQVIGVARDATLRNINRAPESAFYAPLPMRGGMVGADPVILLRTDREPAQLGPEVLALVHAVDPAVWASAYPLRSALENTEEARQSRMVGGGTLGLGLLALLLAAVGLYGVMAFTVTQRTREIGIRMALGARRRDVVGALLKDAGRLVLIGIGFGLAASAAVGQLMRSLLFGVSPFDPVAYGGVSLFLLLVALLAAWLPARRATRVDPALALRSE